MEWIRGDSDINSFLTELDRCDLWEEPEHVDNDTGMD